MIGRPSEERYTIFITSSAGVYGETGAVRALSLGMPVETGRLDLLSPPPSITPYKSAPKAIFENLSLTPLNVPWLHHRGVHHR